MSFTELTKKGALESGAGWHRFGEKTTRMPFWMFPQMSHNQGPYG